MLGVLNGFQSCGFNVGCGWWGLWRGEYAFDHGRVPFVRGSWLFARCGTCELRNDFADVVDILPAGDLFQSRQECAHAEHGVAVRADQMGGTSQIVLRVRHVGDVAVSGHVSARMSEELVAGGHGVG